jgi:N-acetyl-alpha-D-muramate 1-phosphate uridylyltransferase
MVALADPPQVVLLAGGRGERLRPLTDTIPKCLAPVARRPFLAYVLEDLRRCGVRRALLCTGYLAGAVEREVGDGRTFGLQVTYSVDPPGARGTLAALRRSAALLDRAFVLRYADSHLPFMVDRFARQARACSEPAAMAVLHNRDAWGPSNVVVAGNRVIDYGLSTRTRCEWIDYGMVALTRDLVAEVDCEDHAPLYRRLARSGRLAAVEVDRRFYDIGTPDAYREFCGLVEAGVLP